MTQHIIDTDELEKLPQYATFQSYDGSLTIHAEEEYVKMSDIHALIANSPQADANTPPDVYDIAVDTGDGIYHTAEVVHFQQSGSKRMIQVRLGEPQADDVRKDAERYRFLREGKYIHNGEPFIARNFGASFSQWTSEDADKVIDQAIDKARE